MFSNLFARREAGPVGTFVEISEKTLRSGQDPRDLIFGFFRYRFSSAKSWPLHSRVSIERLTIDGEPFEPPPLAPKPLWPKDAA